jgi:hypothetical protein
MRSKVITLSEVYDGTPHCLTLSFLGHGWNVITLESYASPELLFFFFFFAIPRYKSQV